MPISAIVEITTVTNSLDNGRWKPCRRERSGAHLIDWSLSSNRSRVLQFHGSATRVRARGSRVDPARALAVLARESGHAISSVTLTASVSFFPCSSALNASSSGKLCVWIGDRSIPVRSRNRMAAGQTPGEPMQPRTVRFFI